MNTWLMFEAFLRVCRVKQKCGLSSTLCRYQGTYPRKARAAGCAEAVSVLCPSPSYIPEVPAAGHQSLTVQHLLPQSCPGLEV